MITRRKQPRKKALWTRAFPKQVDNHVDKNKAAEKRLYRQEALAFVAAAIARGETCPVVDAIPELHNGMKYGHKISAKLNEVHHRQGRRGKLLRHQPLWMACSKQGHRWIHANTAEAARRGWLLSPWNKQT